MDALCVVRANILQNVTSMSCSVFDQLAQHSPHGLTLRGHRQNSVLPFIILKSLMPVKALFVNVTLTSSADAHGVRQTRRQAGAHNGILPARRPQLTTTSAPIYIYKVEAISV